MTNEPDYMTRETRAKVAAEPERFAIRFLPANPKRRDEPAMYLSTENPLNVIGMALRFVGAARLTTSPDDVEPFRAREVADAALMYWPSLWRLMAAETGLVADVVPLADALRDLAS